MADHFHQIRRMRGKILRHDPSQEPMIEIQLRENERVVKLDTYELAPRRRTTVDIFWTAWIDCDCGEVGRIRE